MPHEANNQYGGGILERRCCVQRSTCIKTHGIAMRAVGEVLIYERELTMLQYHSKCTNISHCNYFTSLFIHCRKYFTVVIIPCTKFSHNLFSYPSATTKIFWQRKFSVLRQQQIIAIHDGDVVGLGCVSTHNNGWL